MHTLTKRSLLLALPLLTALGSAQAATLYIAPTGNDTAAGTHSAPWKSLARAQQAAQPGDTVYLRGGTYAFSGA